MSWFDRIEATLDKIEQALNEEAQTVVHNFWEQIRERKRKKQNEGTLGVRVIHRPGWRIQIVWYRKRWVGPKGDRTMLSKGIAKGRNRNTYPAQKFASFTEWERELAALFEEDFATIREASAGLSEQRQSLKRLKAALEELDMVDVGEA